MTKSYRDIGIETYGDRCEICGYGIVEVHHIDYQRHQLMENALRASTKRGEDISLILGNAHGMGFLEWDGHQLSKDDRTTNLSVLCPSCHTLMHTLDASIKLLRAIPKRK